VVPDTALTGPDACRILDLVSTPAPIKVIALASGNWGVGSATESVTPSESPTSHADDLGLMALAHPHLFVLQTSIGHAEHFAESVSRALLYDGPAVIRVLAPCPSTGGFAPRETVTRARAAVDSGSFRLFRLEPDAEAREEARRGLRRFLGGEAVAPSGAVEAAPEELGARIRELEGRLAGVRQAEEQRVVQVDARIRQEMADRIQNRLRLLLGKPAGGPPGRNGS
jgi:pyruvate/2-oxoacid:ferredoxin oxidoreductase beta subunit